MASHKIIADSDDEDGASSSDTTPQKIGCSSHSASPSKAAEFPSKEVTQIGTSSTDSVLFQAVYNAERAAIEPATFTESHAHTDNVPKAMSFQEGMSKESELFEKTGESNIMPLTATSTPKKQNLTLKRARTIADAGDLAQLATFSNPGALGSKDVWEFPSSNSSDRSINGLEGMRVTSRNAKYGVSMAAKQVDHKANTTASSPYSEITNSQQTQAILEISTPNTSKRKRASSYSTQDVDNASPLHKVRRTGIASQHDTPEDDYVAEEAVDMITSSTERGRQRQFTESTIQVPRSNPMQEPKEARTAVETSLDSSSANKMSSTSLTLIPNSLTGSQKLQNKSVANMSDDAKPPQRDFTEVEDPFRRFTGESSTMPNDTPILNKSLSSKQTSNGSLSFLRSSSPAHSPSLKVMKRSKSEAGTKFLQKADSEDSSWIESSRQRKRSASVDELSLDASNSAAGSGCAKRNQSIGSKRKRTAIILGEAGSNADNTPISQHVLKTQKENYQPRPSRSRSRVINDDEFDAALKIGMSNRTRKKTQSQKIEYTDKEAISDRLSLAQNEETGVSNNQGNSHSQEALIKDGRQDSKIQTKCTGLAQSCSGEPNSSIATTNEAKQTGSASTNLSSRPRRGKPKKAERQPSFINELPDTQLQILSTDALEPSNNMPLSETSLNKSPQKTVAAAFASDELPRASTAPQAAESTPDPETVDQQQQQQQQQQDTMSTPQKNPVKSTATSREMLKTPTKQSSSSSSSSSIPGGKTVGQHSPLPSGRVPYRVGLSKRNRIAPLLKMIRK